MEVTSCEIETKFKCKVNVDLKDIDKEYEIKDGEPFLASNKWFTATFKNGSQFEGRIMLTDQRLQNSGFMQLPRNHKCIYIIMAEKVINVKDLYITYDISINDVKKSIKARGEWIKFSNINHRYYGSKTGLKDLEDIQDKISTCKGFIDIEFRPTSRVVKKDQIKGLIYHESLGSETKEQDFAIICQYESFHFNKIHLCSISDVFQKMIETSDMQEAQSGSVHIEDFSPKTIRAFKRVMFENDVALDLEDLTANLLKFANKYCISPLFKVVANHLSNNLSFENIYDVIEAAYLIDNEELLQSSAKFINGNHGHFKNNDKWKWNLMMFNNSN